MTGGGGEGVKNDEKSVTSFMDDPLDITLRHISMSLSKTRLFARGVIASFNEITNVKSHGEKC